jgi:xanthine dehydrogenase accessory factor
MAETRPPKSSRPTDPTDVLRTAHAWLARDGRVAMATVVDTWGSAPVPVGGQMAVGSDGSFQGSVSGGCIEGEVIVEAEEVLESGAPKTLEFGVADETAWRAGLPCGGQVRVFVERLDSGSGGRELLERAVAAGERRSGLVVKTHLADGRKEVFERTDSNLPEEIEERFRTAKSKLEALPEGGVFLHALVPPARIIIVGATHIGQVLTEVARLAGYEVIVVDPRTAFASPDRFPNVRLVTDWPQDALPELGLDPYSALVALAHVGHIDDEALKLAVRSDSLYIGALGSSRNHAKRKERLKAAGITDAEIGRIKAPIGLDIGAQSPAEVAVAIMADIILAVRGRKQKPAGAREASS